MEPQIADGAPFADACVDCKEARSRCRRQRQRDRVGYERQLEMGEVYVTRGDLRLGAYQPWQRGAGRFHHEPTAQQSKAPILGGTAEDLVQRAGTGESQQPPPRQESQIGLLCIVSSAHLVSEASRSYLHIPSH